MTQLKIWIAAARPKTLLVCLAPIALGTTLGSIDGRFHLVIFLCIAITALSLQIGANLVNDLCDHLKGSDTPMRRGPTRVMASGLLTQQNMLRGIFLIFSIAACASIPLIYRGGPLFFVILVASILSAIFYTAGPFSLAYLGIADLFAFTFFGPLPVIAIVTLLGGHFEWTTLLLGAIPGLYAAAVLNVNNIRDYEEDRQNGKKSLAVRFGPLFAKRLYLIEMGIAWLLPLIYVSLHSERRLLALPLLTACALPAMLKHLDEPHRLNALLAKTALLNFIVSFMLSLCLFLSTLIT